MNAQGSADSAHSPLMQCYQPTAAPDRTKANKADCCPPASCLLSCPELGANPFASQPALDYPLPNAPEPQELDSLLLGDLPGDLPGFSLDLDSMMDELEALTPGQPANPSCGSQALLGRTNSQGSDPICSFDSSLSAESMLRLHHCESSPDGASAQGGISSCNAASSSGLNANKSSLSDPADNPRAGDEPPASGSKR